MMVRKHHRDCVERRGTVTGYWRADVQTLSEGGHTRSHAHVFEVRVMLCIVNYKEGRRSMNIVHQHSVLSIQ
jgi:hypothetical protein